MTYVEDLQCDSFYPAALSDGEIHVKVNVVNSSLQPDCLYLMILTQFLTEVFDFPAQQLTACSRAGRHKVLMTQDEVLAARCSV